MTKKGKFKFIRLPYFDGGSRLTVLGLRAFSLSNSDRSDPGTSVMMKDLYDEPCRSGT